MRRANCRLLDQEDPLVDLEGWASAIVWPLRWADGALKLRGPAGPDFPVPSEKLR
jgi:hypothetical protein